MTDCFDPSRAKPETELARRMVYAEKESADLRDQLEGKPAPSAEPDYRAAKGQAK